ncbi:MAG: glycerophosphodiester phosphodiesterase [Flavobacteriales bacterium]|nr:glycerophosphodiester phosphodiesterase [Flavobacteriales bacterium]
MKKKLPFVALLLLIVGLSVWKYVHRTVELEKVPIILGHGGMGVRSPLTLDSKHSIQTALAYPIEGTEIDVRMTLDNVLISFHDEELPLLSGCPGFVWEKTYSSIYECSHGVFHKAEPVDALDTLLGSPWKEGTIFSLDLKLEPEIDSLRLRQFQTQIVKLVNQFPQFRFLIESKDLAVLGNLKREGVKAELFLYAQEADSAISSTKENGFNGISINAAHITKKQIQEAQQSNVKVMIWGAGSVFSNRKLLGLDADIIQTDAIKSMVILLNR